MKKENKPLYTKEQIESRLHYLCAANSYTFVRFTSEVSHLSSTFVELSCPTHNHTWQTRAAYFIRGRGRCLYCTKAGRAAPLKVDDEVHIQSFLSAGAYLDGTTFARASHGKQAWNVYCPVCSNDEYVKAGVCNGIFKSLLGNLKLGRRCCRCHSGFRYTPSQREYQVKRTFVDESLPYEFLGWVGESRAGKSARLMLSCSHHGVFSPFLDTYLNGGTRCPDCAISGFRPEKPATLYVIKTSDFTGYGITGNFAHRLSVHKKNLRREGIVIDDFEVYEMSGHAARDLESAINAWFPAVPCKVEGFVRESTYHYEYYDVLKFIEGYLNSSSTKQPSEPSAPAVSSSV